MEHQIIAVNDIVKNYELGRRGSFLWIPVGMGKTFIICKFLKYLKENNKLPPYIIYTLPSSAIKSVIQEIKDYGFEIDLLIPIKDMKHKQLHDDVVIKQVCEPEQYRITMIEHDYLRRCENKLLEVAPKFDIYH